MARVRRAPQTSGTTFRSFLMSRPSHAHAPWPVWRRVLGTWGILAVLMTLNGGFREVVLRPALGADAAGAVSAALGVLLLLAATRWRFPPLTPYAGPVLFAMSGLLLGLTVAFETLLGRFVDHRSWVELAAHYALWRGELWPLVLLGLALTPFLWGRWYPPRAPRSHPA